MREASEPRDRIKESGNLGTEVGEWRGQGGLFISERQINEVKV